MGGGNSKPKPKCKGTAYGTDPQQKPANAKWCADEGQRCYARGGTAVIYYGAALSWRQTIIPDGHYVECTNQFWGCDPLWGSKKWCFKKQDISPTPKPTSPAEKCDMDTYISFAEDIYGIKVGNAKYQYEDCAAARADLQDRGEKAMTQSYQNFIKDKGSVEEAQAIEAYYYNSLCAGCSSSSDYSDLAYAHPDIGAVDDWNPSTPLFASSGSIDSEMVLPLLVALLVIINCVCILYICIRKCMVNRNVYKVARYESETEIQQS